MCALAGALSAGMGVRREGPAPGAGASAGLADADGVAGLPANEDTAAPGATSEDIFCCGGSVAAVSAVSATPPRALMVWK